MYLALFAYGFFLLRLTTMVSWLSGGWPEWIASADIYNTGSIEDDAAQSKEFNDQINTVYSILSITLIVLNAMPGILVDTCRRTFQNPSKGITVGISICFGLSFIFMFVASLLGGIRTKDAAYTSVIIFTIGKAFGVVWSPTYLFLFPVELYGTVFGLFTLVSLPFITMNQFMYDFNILNDEFSTMNFVLAGLSVLLLLIPVTVIRRYKHLTHNQPAQTDKELTTQL